MRGKKEKGGREEVREKQERGAIAGWMRQKTAGGWHCCLFLLTQRRIKWRREGKTEEPGSLVGWRWRGSPTRHTWGCTVRPGGHSGWWPTVRVRRSSRARRDRGTPSRRRPRWRSTRAWAGWGSWWSPAVWSWAGSWRPSTRTATLHLQPRIIHRWRCGGGYSRCADVADYFEGLPQGVVHPQHLVTMLGLLLRLLHQTVLVTA